MAHGILTVIDHPDIETAIYLFASAGGYSDYLTIKVVAATQDGRAFVSVSGDEQDDVDEFIAVWEDEHGTYR